MPLNVLQIATGFPSWGGTELHILNLSEQLRRRGHTVTVACRPGCWVEQRAGEMGLPTVPIRIMKQHDWQDFAVLREFLRTRKVDVLHVHWSSDVLVPGFAALREKVPVRIMSRHMPYPFKNRVGSWLYSQVLYSRLVTVSGSVRDTLVKCGVPKDRIQVIHHGTDVEAFEATTVSREQARRDLGLADGDVAVGIVGRVAPEKGHQYLLQAVRSLGADSPVRIVVVGGGPDEDQIKALAEEPGLKGRVVFAGFRQDVNNAIHALDIVTVPSTWNEPCSAVVQQGMALSKPVVGTRAGGTPEMIAEGETGLLVPVKDSEALAAALRTLAADPALRARMGAAGRRRVGELFSLSGMTDRIEELYARELDLSRGRQSMAGVSGAKA